MLNVYMIALVKDGQISVFAAHTNKPSATMQLSQLQLLSEEPESDFFGVEVFMLESQVNVEIFDLWRKIRQHPAYAFGALFTLSDMERGIPEAFDREDCELSMVEHGQKLIDDSYEGEPQMHRLTARLRRATQRLAER